MKYISIQTVSIQKGCGVGGEAYLVPGQDVSILKIIFSFESNVIFISIQGGCGVGGEAYLVPGQQGELRLMMHSATCAIIFYIR